ncbi:SDR family NAD(P)-dependent oxidoreductase [Aureispira anguillae]|uniref:SDR family NAD(P)-dependent oxidoreductase n=1 Tax=Aureispira anguillae TaxID=2864201 RepID=A0A916DRQ6_9BACT|nr:SDR family NAD(P)-dependent oxidoreductase [Aureispira anguillae]BDS10780.1 SDR family NAD(P)-dependent oxidoreductase [Aureispira anguillae]
MVLQNKRILITGGSSGIGKATAIELAKQGAIIILQARNVDKLKAAATEISLLGAKVHYYSTDLTTAEAVEASANTIIQEVGLPDIVINSAGSGDWLSLKEATPKHYETTMASPYLATAFTCKVFYDKMQARGSGHFIIINSVASYFSFPAATGYTAARWAMLGFAKSLQADLYASKFNVSLVTLGKVSSPYFTNNPTSEERIPKISDYLVSTMSEEYSGKVIAKVAQFPKQETIKPFMLAILVRLNRFIPGLFAWLMRLTAYKAK